MSTGSVDHAITAGMEFSSESSVNYARTGPTAPTADLYHPNPNDPYPGPIVRSGASTDGAALSAAAYAFDTVSIGNHVELTGGVRWDRFDVDYTSVAVGGVATSFARTDTMTSGRAGAIYKPRPEGSIYLGWGTSFNPSAEGLSLAAANVALEPEKSRNIEAGTKWDVMRQQLSATAAIFRTDKTNARTPGVNPGDPPTVLSGKQRVSGVEFGISGPYPPLVDRDRQLRPHDEATIEQSNTVGRGRSESGVHPGEHLVGVDDVRPAGRHRRRRRRAVHGQRVPQCHQHHQRAELLAD